jgi:hypothetical protein
MGLPLFLIVAALSLSQARHVASGGDCVSAPCVSTVNIPFDSVGIPCPQGTWGVCDARRVPIQFDDVPAGYSVAILRVYGDFIAFAHGSVADGSHAGILFGLFNSEVGLSPNVEYGSQGCFLYLQGSVGSGDFRGAYDQVIPAGGILPANNVLISQEAVFLNDTERSIHEETSMALVYRFVKSD